MIEVCGACLVYSDHGKPVYACRDVNLRVGSGEYLGILGPSGSGKSSLLYLMSGLKMPSSGEVLFEGKSVHNRPDAERARLRLSEFGFVFQHPFLIGYLSALENVLISQPGTGDFDEASALLDELGLNEKKHRLPHELSGGERQRVCVARALLGSPKVVFCDEPTASLDHANGLSVMDSLNQHRRGGSLVVVTHDETMLQSADRKVRIQEGQVVE